MSHLLQILKKSLVTERAANMKAEMNKYVFRVALTSSKGDIKQAVEELFKVNVTGVHTMRVQGKFRRMGNAAGAYRPDWKKAIVTIKPGQEIKPLEESQ